MTPLFSASFDFYIEVSFSSFSSSAWILACYFLYFKNKTTVKISNNPPTTRPPIKAPVFTANPTFKGLNYSFTYASVQLEALHIQYTGKYLSNSTGNNKSGYI